MSRSNRLMRACALIVLMMMACAAVPTGAAFALTNAQLQLAGGLAAVHGAETYFFAPMDDKAWGLFALSSCAQGPIATLNDVKPSRLIYADSGKVYFTAARQDEGQILASLDLKTGAPTMLVDKVKEIYYETDETIFYSSYDDQLTLYRYSFTKNTSSKLKTMTSKNIYDCMLAEKEKVYFLGKDIRDGSIVGYKIDKPGAKAVNTDVPSPAIGDGYLYNGYLVYTPKGDTTKVYTVAVGKTKGVRLGEQITSMSLNNDRFGDALYPYDADSNSIVRVPLDASPTTSLALTTMGQAQVLIGGAGDAMLYWDDGQVWSVNTQLQNKTPLFPFNVSDEGVRWTNMSPTTTSAVLMYGYSVMTYLDSYGVTLPTVVRVMDSATGQMLFQAPASLPQADEGVSNPSASGTPASAEPAPPEAPISEYEDISFFGS
ncbi:MAG: hypothetical protein LBK46_10835 [Oscillospiraceae bacterium]|nr:hypothetical protein [Oscillospiraceae bacterium]